MRSFLFVVVTSFISFTGVGQNAQDVDSVKKVVLAFQEDFNEGSFKNAHNYTTIDWEHINPSGGSTKGRDETLTEVRQVHQTFLKGVTTTIESMTIRFVTTDVAIANVIHKGSAFETPDGVKHENPRSFKTYTIIRQKGKWLLTHDQATSIEKM
jgi:ketosteroid isomerase-like protein